jgi:hypothetical protein
MVVKNIFCFWVNNFLLKIKNKHKLNITRHFEGAFNKIFENIRKSLVLNIISFPLFFFFFVILSPNFGTFFFIILKYVDKLFQVESNITQMAVYC